MKTKWVVQLTVVTVIFSTFFRHSKSFAQGALTPPGAPAPVMKSLDQIEPRTPISGQIILNSPGSYYFTTNVTANGGYGIIVQADNVSIDLGGFTLAGGPNPSSSGILVNGSYVNFTVRNGAVRNWGSVGIDASQSSGNRFESLKIFKNNGTGLLAGNLSQVRACSVSANNGDGIKLGADSMVVESAAIGNGGKGIAMQDDGSIKNSSANANTNGGIYSGLNCLISRCLVISNAGTGIIVSNESSVVDTLVNYNGSNGIALGSDCTVRGCTVFHSASWGIQVANGCEIVDNNCGFNGSTTNLAAIHVIGSANRIDGNNVYSNRSFGIYVEPSGGNLLVRNRGCGNFGDFLFTGSNYFGVPLMLNAGIDSLGFITNSNPWANFQR